MALAGLPPTPVSLLINDQINKLKSSKLNRPKEAENALKEIEETNFEKNLQKGPEKIAEIYEKIAAAERGYREKTGFFASTFRKNKINELTHYFNYLADYAYEHPLDKDHYFNEYGIRDIIITFLNFGFPNSLRSAIIMFIANVARQGYTELQNDLSQKAIESIIFDIFSNGDISLQEPSIKCLVYLTASNEKARDDVMFLFPTKEIAKKIDFYSEKTQKQLINLLGAFSKFPLDDENVLAIIDILIQKRAMYPNKCYKKLILVVSGHENLCIEERETYLKELFVSLKNDSYRHLIIQLLSEIVCAATSELPFDVEDIVDLIESNDEIFSINIMRLIGDLFVNQYFPGFVERHIKRIHDVIRESKGRRKTEAIIMVSQIIRSSPTQDILMIDSENFVKEFMDAIDECDPELIESVIISLSIILQNEINGGNYSLINPSKDEPNIKDKFEELMYSSDDHIAELAEAFVSRYFEGNYTEDGFKYK